MMNKDKFKFLLNPNFRNSKRQELELNLPLVTLLGLALTAVIYGLFFPIKKSPIGILLYERSFTQVITVALACIVVVIIGFKYFLLKKEYRSLRRIWIADYIPLEKPDAPEVKHFQERLGKDGSIVTSRCSRILGSYIQSGDRNAATEFALDDSSFYQSSSESSYSFPRILMWAIPLMGFLGTVLGISQAVGGFSGVLKQAEDIEKIKEGISQVTVGLAVAFDTTLLSLILSILIMIPLVLAERSESKLLLGIDIFINDKLLPRLKEKNKELSEETINNAVKGAIDEHFPQPDILIEPAHKYAQEAAKNLATGFIAEISKIQNISSQVIEQVSEVRQLAAKDRQEFMDFFRQQQQANQNLIEQIKNTVEEIRTKNQSLANGLSVESQEICKQLEQVAQTLESRMISLQQSADKIAELRHFQQSLDNSLRSLEKTASLQEVLVGVKENLAQLNPLLEQLNKPRRITLVEQDNGNVPLS